MKIDVRLMDSHSATSLKWSLQKIPLLNQLFCGDWSSPTQHDRDGHLGFFPTDIRPHELRRLPRVPHQARRLAADF